MNRQRSQLDAPQSPASPGANRHALAQLLVGNQIQQAIYVAAKLGIADLLKSGPMKIEDLAKQSNVDSASLYRLLRALAGFGIFAEDEQRQFGLTPLATLLQADIPGSLRPFALWAGDVSYQAFGGLDYSVRTGKPAFEQIFGSEFFAYLSSHPEVGAKFDDLMAWSTAPLASEILSAWNFKDVETIVDIGGGRGDFLAAILRACPRMQGILVEQRQSALEAASKIFHDAGVADRCRIESANIMEMIPSGGDCYVMKSVIHGLDDAASIQVLTQCRRALTRSKKLMVIEFVMPQGNNPFPGKLMDLLMLVGCHGRERTQAQFETLFTRSGFRIISIRPIKGGYSVMELV